MPDLTYVDDMRKCLSLLGKVERSLTKLKVKKEEYRNNLLKWLIINNLKDYETFDSIEEDYWRLASSIQKRKSCDLEKLQKEYPDAYNACVTYNEINTFKCQVVKSSKNNAPKAPKGK